MTTRQEAQEGVEEACYGSFDFGLTVDEEIRAAKLQTESTVVDAIWWGPVTDASFTDEMSKELRASYELHGSLDVLLRETSEMPGRMAASGQLPSYQQNWDESGVTAGQWEIQVGTERRLLEGAAYVDHITGELPWLTKALRAQDIRDAHARGGHAIYMQCQPTPPISRDVSLIGLAHDVGLRMLQLTYNAQDHVGVGCTDRSPGGVSDFGAALIARLNELGVIVDTAHANERTLLDACAISERPVVISHTAAASIHPHDRCVSDRAMEAVAATGGTVGIVSVPFFLGPDEPSMQTMLDHVDHAVRTVGWDHVSIGTDWPLVAPKWVLVEFEQWVSEQGFRPEHGVQTTSTLDGFSDYRDFPNITRGLVSRGYTDEQIRAVLGENFLRVFEDVCG